MAADITKGTTFTDGQQDITVAQFNPLLTSATITNIDRENMKTDVSLGTMQSAEPDGATDGEVWQDSITHFPKARVSGAFKVAVSPGDTYTLSTTSAAVEAGDVICPSNAAIDAGQQKWIKCLSTFPWAASAVALEAVSPGGTGRLARHGPVRVKATGVINAGEGVKMSSTDGVVQSVGAAGTGFGINVFGVALGSVSGGYVWISLRR